MGQIVFGSGAWNPAVTGGVPGVATAPSLTGTAQVGQTLTGDNGSWTNSPTGYAYKWQRSDNGTTGWTDIAGATSASYTVLAGDATKYLRRGVLASNGTGPAAAYSFSVASSQVAAAGNIPVNTVAPSIEGYNGASMTDPNAMLVIVPGDWTRDFNDSAAWFADSIPNGTLRPSGIMKFPLVRAYQWRRNGVPIAGQVGMTYNRTAADIGQSIDAVEYVTPVIFNGTTYVESGTTYSAATSNQSTASGTHDAELVMPDDLEYLGAFNITDPFTVNGIPNEGFGYGGRAMAWNPAGNGGAGSFFLGNDAGWTAEFSVPALLDGFSVARNSLNNAAILQQTRDARENWFAGIDAGNQRYLYGQLVYNNRLIQTIQSSYSVSEPPVSHARRPLTLATTGQLTSAHVKAGTFHGRFTGGQMCHVPSAWQASIGGPALTGLASVSIVSNTCDGPPAFAFDPDAIASGGVVTAYALAAHRNDELQNTTDRYGEQNAIWHQSALGQGKYAMVWPHGTRSILYFGVMGTGTAGYSIARSFEEFAIGTGPNTGLSMNGFDEAQDSRGPHNGPRRHYCVWAYDANRLAEARALTRTPASVRPYGKWAFTLPYTPALNPNIMSGCYDPATRRVFLVQEGTGSFGAFTIQVFRVNNAVAV